MSTFLSSKNFPAASHDEAQQLEVALNDILTQDYQGSFYAMLGKYQHVLADNSQRQSWPELHQKLETLFKCGKSEVVNGPMIGVPVSIRNSDFLKNLGDADTNERSVLARIEWLGRAWNATYADTGVWMGKAFEPVSREIVAEKTENDTRSIDAYDPETTRIGRNFFRDPPEPNAIQKIAMPVLTELWRLKDRPMTSEASGFDCELLPENIDKEKAIPYTKTGGYFLCYPGKSVIPEMNAKDVYQLNYRWPALGPDYPMTRLVDELVRIDDGIYLGQLIYATKHFSLGNIQLPDDNVVTIGAHYPHRGFIDKLKRMLGIGQQDEGHYYGYQNNGFFLMVDTRYAKEFYADNAFPKLRPRPGEMGFKELGYS